MKDRARLFYMQDPPHISLKQALQRMVHFHALVLEAAKLAQAGGERARITLQRWGALDAAGRITPFGEELLAAHESRVRHIQQRTR